MRRTSAPSQRKNFITPAIGSATSANATSTFSLEKYKYIGNFSQNDKKENVTITANIKKNEVNSPKAFKTSENLSETFPSVRRFNVVYGKQTKKKHKTWEGDGTIEITGKNITLKDTDGKILGQSTCRKNEELIEGVRIFVGSKEVEILDLVEDFAENKKRQIVEDECAAQHELVPISKKTKIDEKLPSLPQICSSSKALSERNQIKKLSSSVTTSSVEALIMPRPSEEHQWQCNTNHLPVTEVQVDYSLTKVLRQHQREGICFLYNCVTGLRSLDYTGAILADEMGLGKTLQCVSLIWTMLNQGFYGGKPLLKRALIVVPNSLVKNWYNEFVRWVGSYRIKIFAVDKDNKIQNYSKSPFMPVVIISYEMLVKNFNYIKDIDFDLIVCDEGHRLKNSNIQTTSLLSQLPCLRRILLTGTPIQNDLKEFYTLVNFVNPGILGSISEFRNNFEKIIEASREPKAPEDIVKEGEEKSKELMKITSKFILRRTQSVIGSYLPPKHELVLFCSMSSIQRKLYCDLTDYCIRKCDNILTCSDDRMDHLSAITCLKKICNHPTLVNNNDYFNDSLLSEIQNSIDSVDGFISSSIKLTVLDSLLNSLDKSNEKIVLVSNFTQTLDVLETYCKMKNRKFSRFDGTTKTALRNSIVSNFNSNHSDIGILLLSSKAGGVGLNLIGASRLVLFDSDWNPANDLQAMARIWRDGQKRSVYIYRFLSSGTIEEKIFQRQLKKAGLNESVVDPLSVSAVKLSKKELKDLFEYNEFNNCSTHDALDCKCDGNGSVPGVPKDSYTDEYNINSDKFTYDFDLEDDKFENLMCESMERSDKILSDDDFDLESDIFVKNEHEIEVTSDNVSLMNSDNPDEAKNGGNEEKRDCEISFMSKPEEIKPQTLRMNQLFLWEHHVRPITSDVLQEIGLNSDAVGYINFLFRNKTI